MYVEGILTAKPSVHTGVASSRNCPHEYCLYKGILVDLSVITEQAMDERGIIHVSLLFSGDIFLLIYRKSAEIFLKKNKLLYSIGFDVETIEDI